MVLISGCFSVSLVWIHGLSNVLWNCRVDELAIARALLPESSSIELGMILASFKLAIARKSFRDANLSWVNEQFCSTARLNWPLMDRRRTNQFWFWAWHHLNYSDNVYRLLSIAAPIQRLLPWVQIRWRTVSSVIHFFCQSPSLTTRRNRLFSTPYLASLTELSSFDIKDTTSFIKLSG